MAADRDWAKDALTYDYTSGTTSAGGSSRIPSGRVSVDPSKCSTQLCQDLLAKYGAGSQKFMPATTTSDPVNDPVVDGWRAYTGSDAYNFQAVNYLITPSERFSLYASGDHALSDNVKFYLHATYVHRRSSNMLAAEPFDTGNYPVQLSMAANNFYNPFGVELFDVRRRLVETGGRSQSFEVGTLHTFGGFQGTLGSFFGPLANWGYDVSAGWAQNDSTVTTNGSLNLANIQNAIGPSSADGTQCLTSGGAVIAGCTPANLFNSGSTPLTAAMIQSLGAFTGVNKGYNQVLSANANVTGELFKLWADSPLALALGWEYRREAGGFTYNPIAIQGLDTDYNGLNTNGSFAANEAYAELNIPIANNKFLVESLEATAAIRFSNYTSFGNNQTYKLGARYSPIHDLTLRGTSSTGYRAPGITALFGGTGPNAEAATDPCSGLGSPAPASCTQQLKRGGGGSIAQNNGDDANQINSTSGGNPDLKPEKATIYTLGLVYEPSWLPGFSGTIDYYNIDISHEIGYITTPIILAGCYPGAGGTPNQAYCDLIKRSPDTGRLADVTDVLQNVGTQSTAGIDIAARYTMPTAFGIWGFQGDANFLLKFNETLADGTLVRGKDNYDLGPNPDVKFNLGVNYANGGFVAAVQGRFIGAYKECADATQGGISSGSGLCYLNPLQDNGTPYPKHTVPFYQVYDVTAGYTVKESFGASTIAIGVRNFFDQKPAPVYNTTAQTNSDPTTYDYVGRDFFVQLQQKF